MKLDEKTMELIAIGASITAGCQPCLRHHVGKARQLGAENGEIAEAIAVGKMVRGGEASEMDRFAEKLAQEAAPPATETLREGQESAGCDCGGVC